jgi:hypothetical protein
MVPAELASRNAVVDTKDAVETYPAEPRPIIEELMGAPKL